MAAAIHDAHAKDRFYVMIVVACGSFGTIIIIICKDFIIYVASRDAKKSNAEGLSAPDVGETERNSPLIQRFVMRKSSSFDDVRNYWQNE
jgi:hypothetical protein